MGFTYNGVHCEAMGCTFAPDESSRWFASPEFSVDETKMNSRDGGYYNGSNANIRQFKQECYFEDITIRQREKIRKWLDRKGSGRLIFDERPFVYYDVRPYKVTEGKLWRHRLTGSAEDTLSGAMTIIFAAHEPFGKMTYSYLDGQDTDGAKNYCDILKAEQMPDAPSLAGGQCLIYNCGSENAPAVITLQGEAPKGIVIENKTNGTKCAITGLPYGLSLRIDGWDGSVAVGEDRKLEFLYHEEGFISLEPCRLIGEAITVEAGERENIIRISGAEADELIGAYIYINGEWVKTIGRQGDGSIALAHGVTIESPITTMAATMNEQEITGDGMNLTQQEIDFTPRLL